MIGIHAPGRVGSRALAVGLSLVLATACAPVRQNAPPNARPDAPQSPAGCSETRYTSLLGKSAAEIDRSALPKAHRFVCHDCMATMDYNPHRLTLQLGPDGKVASVRCG